MRNERTGSRFACEINRVKGETISALRGRPNLPGQAAHVIEQNFHVAQGRAVIQHIAAPRDTTPLGCSYGMVCGRSSLAVLRESFPQTGMPHAKTTGSSVREEGLAIR